MRKESITQAELKELLDYDPDTGIFKWKVCRGGKQIGRVAGYMHNSGYRYTEIEYQHYALHRLAWLYVYGTYPDDTIEIDHINGVRDDNRIANLRLATRAQQMQNKAVYSNSTTKLPGITFHRASGKYAARVNVNGKQIWLGLFTSVEEAWDARVKAKAKHHGFAPEDRGAFLSHATPPELPSREQYRAEPTGVTGVHRVPHRNAYRARIRVGKKLINLGYFDTIAEAEAAFLKAKAERGKDSA